MTKKERQDLVREVAGLCVEISNKDKDQIRRQLSYLQDRFNELAARARAANVHLEPYASDIQDKLNRVRR